jgi:hypothetical protein
LNVNRKTLVAYGKSCTHAYHVQQLLAALRTILAEKINLAVGLTAEKLAKLAVMARKATSPYAGPMNFVFFRRLFSEHSGSVSNPENRHINVSQHATVGMQTQEETIRR